jgi:hypothetical protein
MDLRGNFPDKEILSLKSPCQSWKKPQYDSGQSQEQYHRMLVTRAVGRENSNVNSSFGSYKTMLYSQTRVGYIVFEYVTMANGEEAALCCTFV